MTQHPYDNPTPPALQPYPPPEAAVTPAPVKYTATEVSESLTGYEEIGLETAFGGLTAVNNRGGNFPGRALAFVLFKRQGMTHDDAYAACMSLTAKDLADVFEDEDDEESGKGDEPPVSEPTS